MLFWGFARRGTTAWRGPKGPSSMKPYATTPPTPVRRDLIDSRSSAGSSAPQSRKPLLNDRRSTR